MGSTWEENFPGIQICLDIVDSQFMRSFSSVFILLFLLFILIDVILVSNSVKFM